MPSYIVDPIVTDPEALQREAYDFIISQYPDWVPNEGNLETWMIQALSRMVTEAQIVAAEVPPAIFKFLGSTIYGLPPVGATNALVTSTWTFSSNPAGRTILAGTLVGLEGPEDLVVFEVTDDVIIAAGDLTTGVGQVQLQAVEDGVEGNGLGGVGEPATLVDSVAWVDTVQTEMVSAGGTDSESDESYLDRLSSRLTLIAARPIVPRDFELMAQDFALQQGVSIRALALDGYDPDTDTYNNERFVTVATAVSSTGLDVPTDVVDFIDSELQRLREVNFVVRVVNATRTSIDVAFEFTPYPGFDPTDVEERAEAAVTEYLQPYNYGLGFGEASYWRDDNKLYRQRISAVLDAVEGLDHWDTLTIDIGGGPSTAESFTLPGPAALTTPGTVDGSVTP